MSDILSCETCGRDAHETPIIEKPLRFGFHSDISILVQNNVDGRKQDNMCLDCLVKEIQSIGENHKKRMTIISNS